MQQFKSKIINKLGNTFNGNNGKKRSHASIGKNPEKKAFIDIKETAANQLEDPKDQDIALNIIKHFGVRTHNKAYHKEIKTININGKVYYTLRFRVPSGVAADMNLISTLVANMKNNIRNVIVKWPSATKTGSEIAIHVEVFYYWVKNKNGTPVMGDGVSLVNPIGLDVPKFTYIQHRKTVTEALLSKANVAGSDNIETWNEGIKYISAIADYVYNNSEIIPQIQLFVKITQRGNSKFYSIRFSNMERIEYLFLETLLEKFGAIKFIEFKSEGTTTRDMIVTILCDTATFDTSKSGKSPLYHKRFPVDSDVDDVYLGHYEEYEYGNTNIQIFDYSGNNKKSKHD